MGPQIRTYIYNGGGCEERNVNNFAWASQITQETETCCDAYKCSLHRKRNKFIEFRKEHFLNPMQSFENQCIFF